MANKATMGNRIPGFAALSPHLMTVDGSPWAGDV